MNYAQFKRAEFARRGGWLRGEREKRRCSRPKGRRRDAKQPKAVPRWVRAGEGHSLPRSRKDAPERGRRLGLGLGQLPEKPRLQRGARGPHRSADAGGRRRSNGPTRCRTIARLNATTKKVGAFRKKRNRRPKPDSTVGVVSHQTWRVSSWRSTLAKRFCRSLTISSSAEMDSCCVCTVCSRASVLTFCA